MISYSDPREKALTCTYSSGILKWGSIKLPAIMEVLIDLEQVVDCYFPSLLSVQFI